MIDSIFTVETYGCQRGTKSPWWWGDELAVSRGRKRQRAKGRKRIWEGGGNQPESFTGSTRDPFTTLLSKTSIFRSAVTQLLNAVLLFTCFRVVQVNMTTGYLRSTVITAVNRRENDLNNHFTMFTASYLLSYECVDALCLSWEVWDYSTCAPAARGPGFDLMGSMAAQLQLKQHSWILFLERLLKIVIGNLRYFMALWL